MFFQHFCLFLVCWEMYIIMRWVIIIIAILVFTAIVYTSTNNGISNYLDLSIENMLNIAILITKNAYNKYLEVLIFLYRQHTQTWTHAHKYYHMIFGDSYAYLSMINTMNTIQTNILYTILNILLRISVSIVKKYYTTLFVNYNLGYYIVII